MAKNPLGTGGERQPKRSAEEWCDHLNSTRRDAVNADRAKEGLSPIEWYVREGQVAIRWSRSALAMPVESKRQKPVMDRRGEMMSESDTFKLNREIESLGATKRYRSDGTRYDATSSG